MQTFKLMVPIQVFDEDGNYCPTRDETRLAPAWASRQMHFNVIAESADAAAEELNCLIAEKLGC